MSDLRVRPARPGDVTTVIDAIVSESLSSGYWRGVPSDVVTRTVTSATQTALASMDWTCEVVVPVAEDLDDELVGFALRKDRELWALAWVQPSLRGRGAWRLLRAAAGLQKFATVDVIFGSPSGLRRAREAGFIVHHVPFRVIALAGGAA